MRGVGAEDLFDRELYVLAFALDDCDLVRKVVGLNDLLHRRFGVRVSRLEFKGSGVRAWGIGVKGLVVGG